LSGASITGNYSTSYGSNGTVSLAFDPITYRGSSLATISDIWSLTDGSYTLTLAVDINGRITGSDTAGCLYNGTASIIDPNINIYGVSISLTSCGNFAFNGSYSGYGVVSDNTTTNDTLIYVIDNVNYLLFGSLTRQ